MRKQRMVRVMAWAVVCVSAGRVMGQTATWSGLGATNDWGDVGNWVEGFVPGTGFFYNANVVLPDSQVTSIVNLTFRSALTITSLSSSDYVVASQGDTGSITVNNSFGTFGSPPSGITVAGTGSLTIQGVLGVYSSLAAVGGDLNLTGPVTLGGTPLSVSGSAGRRVAISGSVLQTGNNVISVGSGTLSLSPTSFTAADTSRIQVDGGTFEVNSAIQIPYIVANAGRFRVNAPVLLQYGDFRSGSIVELNADLTASQGLSTTREIVGSGTLTVPSGKVLNAGGTIRVPVSAAEINLIAGANLLLDGPQLAPTVTFGPSTPVYSYAQPTRTVTFGGGTVGSLSNTVVMTGQVVRFLDGSRPVRDGGTVLFSENILNIVTATSLAAPVEFEVLGPTKIDSSTLNLSSINIANVNGGPFMALTLSSSTVVVDTLTLTGQLSGSSFVGSTVTASGGRISGVLSISGGSTVDFSGVTSGSVQVTGGSKLCGGALSNSGQLTVASGSALGIAGGMITNQSTGVIYNSGTLTGKLVNRGNYDQAAVGNFVGTYVHEAGASLNGSPSVSGLYVINGPLSLASGRVLSTRTTADLVNNSVVSMGVGGGVSLGGGTFTNNQTFSGQGVVTNTKVLNRGTVTISSNQLALRSGSRLDNLAGSVTLGSAGELNLDVTSLVTSAATFNISGGRITGEGRFVNNPGGRLSGQGLVDVEFQNGGEVSPVGGTLTFGRAFSSNGTIRLTVDGVLAGGLVTNTGRVYGDGIVSSELVNGVGGRIDPTGTISVARPLVNAGTLLLRNGGTLVTLGGFVGGVNGGTISLAGGQFDGNTSPVVSTGLVSGYGGVVTVGFTNAGAVSLAGGTTLWNGPVVNNAGRTVRVEFGTALFNGAFTNNGNVVVGTGGAVVFAGGSGGTGGGLGEGGSAAVVGTGRMQVVAGAGVELDGLVQGRLEVAGDVVMRSRQDEAGVQVRGASVSRVGVVSITGQGFVDLVDNDLVVTGMGVGSVREMVRTWLRGGVGGLPGEVGLGSSVAFYTEAGAFATLGVYDNSVAGQTMATFGGVAVGAGDVLVKYTYVGDANLDGVVDATDLARVIAGMNGGGGGWNFGDVNYDGVVNAVDLGRTMAALRGQGERLGGGMAGGAGGVIPEPGMVGVLGVVAMGMGRGRRR